MLWKYSCNAYKSSGLIGKARVDGQMFQLRETRDNAYRICSCQPRQTATYQQENSSAHLPVFKGLLNTREVHMQTCRGVLGSLPTYPHNAMFSIVRL